MRLAKNEYQNIRDQAAAVQRKQGPRGRRRGIDYLPMREGNN
jgi:hypothetical protein